MAFKASGWALTQGHAEARRAPVPKVPDGRVAGPKGAASGACRIRSRTAASALRTFGPGSRVPPVVSYAKAEGHRARHALAFHREASEQEGAEM
jgi:hypothetical protein